MHFQNGSPAEPLDPARLPYNAVGFPIPFYVTALTILLSIGGLIATFFTTLSTVLAIALFGPAILVSVAAFLFMIIRAAVHAGVRMDAHDAYLDEQVEASEVSVRAGYLSPERAAQVAAESA